MNNKLRPVPDSTANLWMGLAAGLVVPFVGYAILLLILEQLDGSSLSDTGLNFNFRTRTLSLLALAMNLLPLRYFLRRESCNGVRGIVLATILYGVVWVYFFGRQLMEL